jgi:hypothetical protein
MKTSRGEIDSDPRTKNEKVSFSIIRGGIQEADYLYARVVPRQMSNF